MGMPASRVRSRAYPPWQGRRQRKRRATCSWRALSLNAAFNAWVSRGDWEEELDTLLLQTRDACGDDAYCIGEVYWLWAKAHAFYHRQRRIEEQSPVA
jgi:hypothetical protein